MPVVVRSAQLTQYCRALLEKTGSRASEADLVAGNLITSNLRGHDSHGVGYLPRYLRSAKAGNLKLNGKLEILRETDTLLQCDGGLGYGQVMGRKAMMLGIELAKKKSGMAVVALKNSHHLGRIGAWAEMCVEQGLCSVHCKMEKGYSTYFT